MGIDARRAATRPGGADRRRPPRPVGDVRDRAGPGPWTEVFDSLRLGPALRPALWTENAAAVRRLIGARLTARPADTKALQRGAGAVVRRGRELVAISRGDDGEIHAVGAACTHLGCVVTWNAAERSWDCPCHGSRFSPEGAVLHGPAVAALTPKQL